MSLRNAIALLATFALVLCGAHAFAASQQLPSLRSRGTPAATDYLPIQANGSSQLDQIQLSALTTYITAQAQVALITGTTGQIGTISSGNVVGITLGGDCTFTSPSITCTKTSGVSFAASATTDATNASNIGSGTLNASRLPASVPLISGTPSTGNCVKWASATTIADQGAACGSGGAGGSPGGSSGQIQYNNAGAFGGLALGDLTNSSGTIKVTGWNGASSVPLSALATQAANTIVGNATAGSAAPTALSVPSCSSSASALIYTSGSGFTCNTSINAAQLGGATFASPGAIGGTTAGAGTFSSLTDTGITGSTQCLQVNTSGVVSGSGAACGGSGSTGANPTASVGLTAVNGVATTYLRSDGAPALDQTIAPTWTGLHIYNPTLAASQSAITVKSAPYTAGTATTNFPQTYLNAGASGPTTLSTGGTMLGVNAPSGFAGNLIDSFINGGSSVFKVDSTGKITAGAVNGITNTSGTAYTLTGTASQTYTLPTITSTLAASNAANTWSVGQTFTNSISLSNSAFLRINSQLICSGAAPTITSGLGTSPVVTANSGTCSFELTAGSAGTPTSSIVLGLATASHGWNCFGSDLTHSLQAITTGSISTTAATVTFYSGATATAPSTSDIIALSCFAF